MTYMWNDVQYVVIPVGGASQAAELVALRLDPALVDVSTEQPSRLSPDVTLDQGYPNPAQQEVSIPFSIARAMHVKLTLYNSLGKQVAVLINEVRPAGRHVKSYTVSGLAAGTYYYRLQTDTEELGGQLVVLK